MPRRLWPFVGLAAVGLALTALAVSRWSPEAHMRLADRDRVARQAVDDARALGFEVAGERAPGITAGSRAYSTAIDVRVLLEHVSDPDRRRRLMAVAPPVRLGVRFWEAVGPDGSPGSLLLEYDGEARLVGASFGWDGIVQAGLQPYAGPDFADALAQRLLGTAPPRPEIVKMGGGIEYVYRPRAGKPGAYVYLGGSARWIASLQPVPFALLTRQFTFFKNHPTFQVLMYGALAMAMVLVGNLLWRLSRRRAGFGHTRTLGALLVVGLLPAFAHLPRGLAHLDFAAMYVVASAFILLLWTVAEAELRETRPGSIEHWDRLVCRRPVAGTGRMLVLGTLFGAGLAGLVAASGRIAELVGGGYAGLLVVLPEYWMLPTPLSWGLALASVTAFFISFGRRLASRPGAIAGAALSGIAWAVVLPVGPYWVCGTLGVVLALAAGWLMDRHGLLALAAACVTAVSLPTAVALAAALPLRWGVFANAALPGAVLAFGLVLARRAPTQGSLEAVKPSYVSDLEQEARLAGEVELLREIQLSLLPATDAVSLRRTDVAWRMIPADTVGGDFIDLIEDDAGRLWLALADAAGHGISCSVLTAFTKAAVTEHVGAEVTPADALTRIRRLFARLRTRRSMVTLLLAAWDPVRRKLSVANAGHPPLLIWDGGIREVGKSSSPLGTALDNQITVEEIVDLAPGAILVGYTDGAPEATAPSGEAFGYDRWMVRLTELAGRNPSAATILDRLLADVAGHRAGRPAEDDVTAVVLRLD